MIFKVKHSQKVAAAAPRTNTSKLLSRRAFVGAGAAALAFAGLSACSTSANTQDNNAQTQGKNNAAATEKTKLTFCLDYTPNTNHTGIYVAQAKGYLADEGIELEIIQPAENSAEAIIVSGKAQVGVSYQDYLANVLAADANASIAAVAAVIQHNTSGIMSRQEDNITSPRGMENHRYATWDLPVEQATIKQVMTDDGGDYSKVTLVPYSVDDEVSGLKANLFDTVWVFEGWAVQNAAVQNYPVNYFSFRQINDVFDFYTPVIAANTTYAQENPEVIKAFLRALKKGYEFAIQNPSEAADILCTEVPELDQNLVKKSQEYLAGQYQADAESWGVIDGTRWSKFYAWLNEKGLVEHELNTQSGWTNTYLA